MTVAIVTQWGEGQGALCSSSSEDDGGDEDEEELNRLSVCERWSSQVRARRRRRKKEKAER